MTPAISPCFPNMTIKSGIQVSYHGAVRFSAIWFARNTSSRVSLSAPASSQDAPHLKLRLTLSRSSPQAAPLTQLRRFSSRDTSPVAPRQTAGPRSDHCGYRRPSHPPCPAGPVPRDQPIFVVTPAISPHPAQGLIGSVNAKGPRAGIFQSFIEPLGTSPLGFSPFGGRDAVTRR